ncbi:MAG: 16S rRNA (uracil(1498)-N(3))-methyltransferase [Elusimicrobia bacterium]|nr:16S rRNA (uracil(1498)-N(3))-methyltransferase [Elusimicrobiota bacterium]
MPHFYVDPKDIKDKNFVIENEQFHYLSTVRRFSIGDEINIFDGLGNSYKARIDNIDRNSMSGIILSSKTHILPTREISLYTAIPKGERFDWLIEKAGEIGVSKIVPIIYMRSVVKELSDNKVERYKKISIAASSQSWRADIMPVYNPVNFDEAVARLASKKSTLNVLPWESEQENNIFDLLKENKEIKNINIFIGPEGGFDKTEIDFALKNNFKTVTLGKNILRVETAAIVSASIITSIYNL